MGAKNFRTQTKDSTLNPVWNEVFEVLLQLISTEMSDYCKLLHYVLCKCPVLSIRAGSCCPIFGQLLLSRFIVNFGKKIEIRKKIQQK